MRTPLDAFHQALVNLVEERRRTEYTVRRRRRVGLTEGTAIPGTPVRLRLPTNLARDRAWSDLVRYNGTTGTIESFRTGYSMDSVAVILHADSTPGSWDIPLIFLDLADPPPDHNNIEDIERWLNED